MGSGEAAACCNHAQSVISPTSDKTLSATIFQGLCTSDCKRAVARDWLFHQYLNQLVTTLGPLHTGTPNHLESVNGELAIRLFAYDLPQIVFTERYLHQSIAFNHTIIVLELLSISPLCPDLVVNHNFCGGLGDFEPLVGRGGLPDHAYGYRLRCRQWWQSTPAACLSQDSSHAGLEVICCVILDYLPDVSVSSSTLWA